MGLKVGERTRQEYLWKTEVNRVSLRAKKKRGKYQKKEGKKKCYLFHLKRENHSKDVGHTL